MSQILNALAPYVAPGLVRQVIQNPMVPEQPASQRFPAAVLFADVSGFTTLTEKLGEKGSEGPEELTRLLNMYFGRMIAMIEGEGGEVVKFGGDALIVLFPALDEPLGHSVRRALQTAEAMQAAMASMSTLPTSVGPVSLTMKIGIGAGEVITMQVGGLRNRWEDLVAGDPVRQMSAAEKTAAKGEIILSPEAQALLHPEPLKPRFLHKPDWNSLPDPARVAEALRSYVPGAVRAWLDRGLHEWLSVLRPMSVMFVQVTGIDEMGPDIVQQLHQLVRKIQETVYRFQGTLDRLSIGDKGIMFLILFGAPPLAHEDDPVRALQCALEIQEILAGSTIIPGGHHLHLAIGVASGQLFAGPVGSQARREYTVMADAVNVAARLMSLAGPGNILCDYETYRQACSRVCFADMSSVRVKGKTGYIGIFRPLEMQRGIRHYREAVALVGRNAEMDLFEEILNAINEGQSKLLTVKGEAGIGKSRLVSELRVMAQSRGFACLAAAGNSIEQQTPYSGWRVMVEDYFGLVELEGDKIAGQERVRHMVDKLAPNQIERLPLLNDILNLQIPENKLTAALNPSQRKQSLHLLLADLFLARVVERPLLVIIDDAQWLDSLSWELSLLTARSLNLMAVPLMLVLVTRPVDPTSLAGRQLTIIQELSHGQVISLGELTPDETEAVVANRLGLNITDLPPLLISQVRRRAGGNPFFAEEFLFALRDQGAIAIEASENGGPAVRLRITGDVGKAAQELPETLHGLILARIDQLSPPQQMTLRIAAVIGRTFTFAPLFFTLQKYTPVETAELKRRLQILSDLDLTYQETPEPELGYIFKHIITQEVAYQSLLYAQRRQIHATLVQWYEAQIKDGEKQYDPNYPLLVHHCRQAGDLIRERHYARRAGECAAAQFANEEAVAYYSRAIELTPESDLETLYQLRAARENLYDLQGDRELQAQDLDTLTQLAQLLDTQQATTWRQVEVALRQAAYNDNTGDYSASLAAAQQAVGLAQMMPFTTFNDGKMPSPTDQEAAAHLQWGRALWRQGLFDDACYRFDQAQNKAEPGTQLEADILRNKGIVFSMKGELDQARICWEQALENYRSLNLRWGESATLSNLGILARYERDYAGSVAYFEQALEIRRLMGDRQGEGSFRLNLGAITMSLGQYEQARESFKRALILLRQVGNRNDEGLTLYNLGLVARNQAQFDEAERFFQDALTISRRISDRQGESLALTGLGSVYREQGQLEKSVPALETAVSLRQEMGQEILVIESRSELAQVYLAQNNLDAAIAQVEQVLEHIGLEKDEANSLDRAEEPMRIYLNCYRVLKAAGDSRAAAVLATAYQLLQEQAGQISDLKTRDAFLYNVHAHRAILEEQSRLTSPV